MKRAKLAFIVLLFFLFDLELSGQTSDISKGCLPLKVTFMSNNMNQYYWDFKDGSYSTEQNPVHTFTKAGSYLVMLKDGPNGKEIGGVIIKVFDIPNITITADVIEGCRPLKVTFNANILADTAIVSNEFRWTFGDGTSSPEMMPSHIYDQKGLFDVALGIKTNQFGCESTKISTNFIKVSSIDAKIEINSISDCDVPYTYQVINSTEATLGNSYFWDFGNGMTSTNFDVNLLTFDSPGNYTVTLKVTDQNGCVDAISQVLFAGKPNINLTLKRDSICLTERVVVTNNGASSKINWTFDETASIMNSTLRTPQWHYLTPGLKTVKYSVGNDDACIADTSFTIYVSPEPNSDFIFSPQIGCHNPHEIIVIANDKSHRDYFWQKSSVLGSAIDKVIVVDPKRDSLYMHYRDTVILHLTVKNAIGCQSFSSDTAFHQMPDAYFITSEPKGCAPLVVNFKDETITHVPVKTIRWIFGDGQFVDKNGSDDITHTYNKPGMYYARSIIENIDGCIDTSASLVIKVGKYINPEIMVDKESICLGDSATITFLNVQPEINAYHIHTDEGRFDHCWNAKTATHKFNTAPGEFPVIAAIDYNGCLSIDTFPKSISVKGTKANIGYMTNCKSPLSVSFENKSINGTAVSWQIQDSVVSANNFEFLFDKKGDYNIRLIAQNSFDGCAPDTIFTMIHLRELNADFKLPEIVCDNDIIELSAAESIDVDNDCSKGYLWKFTHQRPVETSSDSIQTFFPSGRHIVKLIVEDINGCKDTLEKQTQSFGIYPKILANDTEFCFPFNLEVKDLSSSDTLITSWSWSDGSTTQDLNTRLTTFFDIQNLILTLQDVNGCIDTAQVTLNGYNPISNLSILPQDKVCAGNPIRFFATDYTEKGSNLIFNYDFGDNSSSTLQAPIHTYTTAGMYNVLLKFEELSSGCVDSLLTTISVISPPQAMFTSSEDENSIICHPKIIDFTNQSIIDGNGFYNWVLGANSSSLTNPSEAFAKGTHKILLYAISPYGCQDTFSRIYNLVGPEGNIGKDKIMVCKREEVSFSLKNAVDANTWSWQFGDGIIIENKNPVSRSFDFDEDIPYIPIDLILRSNENGCSYLLKDSLLFLRTFADFTIIDSSLCQGLLSFENLSEGAVKYEWTFNEKNSSTEINPTYLFDSSGEKNITLIATGTNINCKDTINKTYIIDEFKEVVFFPNIFTPNGDGENDIFTVSVPQEYKERTKVTSLKIYNRWGHLISETPQWDGTYQGENAPAEIYAYYMEVSVDGCRTYTKKGNVTLIR